MDQNAIDSVYLACSDRESACRAYERLGLRLSSASEARWLDAGLPGKKFSLHFLDDQDARLRHLISTSGLLAIALRVADVASVLTALVQQVTSHSFPLAGIQLPTAWLGLRAEAGTDIVFVQSAADEAPAPAHDFPLRRLDHLAIVAHDLEVKTRFWQDVLRVPVAGEIVTPTMIIRQMRIGDAVLELLGPASPDSPLHQRPAGLVSMASWEVADLDEAVRKARAAGFTPTDATKGVLPGTRIATIPGTELAGVNMQLLQYV